MRGRVNECVQIGPLTRIRCTRRAGRSRGEIGPEEAAEDMTDRRHVPPHPARDFRQPFSRLRVIPYASIPVSLHTNTQLYQEKERKERLRLRAIFASVGKNRGVSRTSNIARFDLLHPSLEGAGGGGDKAE